MVIFGNLDDTTIGDLVGEMLYETTPIGTKIVQEGDDADSLFVIIKGDCGVYLGGVKVHVLSKFDIFGENALTKTTEEIIVQDDDEGSDINPTRRRRNATVIAESDPTQLLKLTRDAFEALVESGKLGGNGANVLGRVQTVSMTRMKSNSALRTLRREHHDEGGSLAIVHVVDRSQDFSLFTNERPLPPKPPPGQPPSTSST